MYEALLYETDGSRLRCRLCPHNCSIAVSLYGLCSVRRNLDSKLYSLNYGNISAAAVDPIEKKPLYHFLPGSKAFSIASPGCNMKCLFCQNWNLSQPDMKGEEDFEYTDPEKIIEAALRSGSKAIAYTYSEPTVFFEYVLDTAKLAAQSGLKNVMISNGYINIEALDMLMPFLDAANVDLKFFDEGKYKKYCGASLGPVKETIKHLNKNGIWIEITTLVLAGLNDSAEELSAISDFIAGTDNSIPWHISRAFPHYKMPELDATPETSLDRAYEAGRKSCLKYIYRGNISSDNNTYCSNCGTVLVERDFITARKLFQEDSLCPACGQGTEGIWYD